MVTILVRVRSNHESSSKLRLGLAGLTSGAAGSLKKNFSLEPSLPRRTPYERSTIRLLYATLATNVRPCGVDNHCRVWLARPERGVELAQRSARHLVPPLVSLPDSPSGVSSLRRSSLPLSLPFINRHQPTSPTRSPSLTDLRAHGLTSP